VAAKEQFGISMAAMIYRAEKLKIIDERTTKRLWIQFAKRGWRENEPGEVKQDRARRLERMIDKAVFARHITWSEVALTLGVTRRDLDARMKLAVNRPTGDMEIDYDDELKGGFPPSIRLMPDT
jgi:hypothetical protein